MSKIVEQHRSHGPHIQLSDAVVFITWRLAFTLPRHLEELYNELKKPDIDNLPNLEGVKRKDINLFNRFCQYDDALGKLNIAGISLNKPDIVNITKEALHYYYSKTYELHAYCIMSNHLHILIKPQKDETGCYYKVSSIVQKIKSFTAQRINKHLNRQGQLWDRFYFDRIIRDHTDYLNVVQYIVDNPVKAGLTDKPEDWPDSYLHQSLR